MSVSSLLEQAFQWNQENVTQPVLISEWLAAHVTPFTGRCFYLFVYSRFCEQVKSCFAQYCSTGAAMYFVFVTHLLTSWTFHGKQNMRMFIFSPLSDYYRTVLFLGGGGLGDVSDVCTSFACVFVCYAIVSTLIRERLSHRISSC